METWKAGLIGVVAYVGVVAATVWLMFFMASLFGDAAAFLVLIAPLVVFYGWFMGVQVLGPKR